MVPHKRIPLWKGQNRDRPRPTSGYGWPQRARIRGTLRSFRLVVDVGGVEDAYYPYGRSNMLEVAFLASHLLEMRSSADQDRLVDLVTTKAARVLGVPDHALVAGSQANLCVHDCERVVDLLREHAAPRWVISKGRLVVSTESRTTWHVESIGA